MAMLFALLSSPIIGTLPVGAYLYSTGEINVMGFILGCILPLSVIPNTFAIVMSLELYSMIETSWRMIRKVMRLSDLKRPDEDAALDASKSFEFKNVSFEYEEDVEVLHDVSFEVDKNSVFAIVGESGSGKSTIAKLMVSFFDVKSGSVCYGGVDIKDISISQLMRHVSYVAQDNFLFDASLRENLKIAKHDASDEELERALKLANCQDLIERLPQGIDTQAGDCGKLLSGGERQRLTLARAMLCDAECIILDEATAYADPENEAKIQDAISELVKEKTLIVVAHRLHTITEANKIMVVDKGRIVGIGEHEELLKHSSHYRKLWKHYKGNEGGE